jgi:OmcA/MtrC family decaheme c-type cytochrome
VHTLLSKKWGIRLAALLLLAASAMYLVSADGPEFTEQDKAYYADANMVAFVRPGLVFKITAVTVAADGTVKVRYTISDPKGLPLDREGIYTPGAVTSSWVLAYIPKGKTQYVSYTTRTQTSPITGKSEVQAGSDSPAGTYEKVADGEYIYTFTKKLPAGYDKTVTHTVGLYGNRNLTEFDLGIYPDDLTYNFVPDGSKVTVTRDVIKTVTCNKCHQDLAAHGTGGRKSMEVCILCHQPQTIDPDTGNTVDMPVMIHKIHFGASLTKGYTIIGNSQSVHDYSEATPIPSDARRCTFCHEQNTGAAQASAYNNANRAACGACHDDVNFATGEKHGDLPQISDNQCTSCHTPDGEVEFDISIKGAHTVPAESRYLPGTVFGLKSITKTAPGQNPVINFTVKTKAGNVIPIAEMNRVRFQIASPNTDWATRVQEDVVASKVTTNVDGSYTYTMTYAVPAEAKGSYTLAVEGYRNYTILVGTVEEQTIRDFGYNQMLSFSVDGTAPVARRSAVSTENCNKCHASISFHGGNRNNAQYCAVCHTPNAVTTATATAPSQAYAFRLMIHKIHTGEELTSPYCFGTTCFNDIVYPGFRQNCTACHINDSQQLPLDAGLLPVKDPQGLLNPVAPEAASCLSCHTTVYAASHALANTTSLGESCATCHGPNAEFSVNRAHAR